MTKSETRWPRRNQKNIGEYTNGISEDHSIVIQGVGADGRTRNATFYLLVMPRNVACNY